MPRGRKSEAAMAETRAELVAAARKIITEEGLQGLTARKLATAVGCAVGSIYTSFKTLDDVIRAANGEEMDALYDRLEAGIKAASDDIHDAARAIVREYLAFSSERGRNWSAVFEHMPADESPQWYKDKQLRLFSLSERLLQPLAPGDAGARAARALWAALHGVDGLNRAGHLERLTGQSAAAVAQDIVEGYIAGLMNRQPA